MCITFSRAYSSRECQSERARHAERYSQLMTDADASAQQPAVNEDVRSAGVKANRNSQGTRGGTMRRRGRGEGSITKRPDGRWMARVDLGWRDGKRRYKAYYGRTRAAVQDKLRKAIG